MSLLTKASTVTTPTAYSEGLLHSVKPVVNLASELVTNGDFSDGSTGWTAGTGWSISGGQATHSGSTGNLVTNASLSTNNRYLVTFEIISIDNGVCNIYDTSTATTYASFSTAGIKSTIITKDSSADLAFRSSSSDAVIDNVSIKEVIGADFDFSRASAATRVNEQGLIEKERGNLLLQSNSFDTTWTTSSASVTSGQSGYDGSSDAWLLTATSTSNCRINQSISGSGVQTLSVYAKANTADFLAFNPIVGGTNPIAYFDLSNGLVGTTNSAVIDTEIISIGSSWYRCSISFNDTNTQMRILVVDADNSTAVTSGNSIYIQDAELEEGLVVTDYIETTTSAVYSGITDNIPRINYEGGNGSFLLEGQRTNLVEHSEFIDSSWNPYGNISITDNSATSPEGVENATEISAAATTTAAIGIQDGFTVSAGTEYTISFFAKKGDFRYIQLFHGGGQVTSNARTNFDIQEGVVAYEESGVVTASVKDYGNGWYRCSATMAALLTTLQAYIAVAPTAGAVRSPSISATAGENYYLYGIQVEASSYPTSYIPTYGSTVTRVGETCNNAGNSDLFNDSEGVLYAEIAALTNDGTGRVISLNDGSSSNRIHLFYFVASNTIYVNYRVSGTSYAIMDAPLDSSLNFNKIAYKFSSGDFALWVNGVEVDTDGNTTMMPSGTIDRLDFNAGGGGSDFYGKTKMVSTFTEALSDSELECLTSWSSFNRMATAQNYTIE